MRDYDIIILKITILQTRANRLEVIGLAGKCQFVIASTGYFL
jgi:hypothetical protein